MKVKLDFNISAIIDGIDKAKLQATRAVTTEFLKDANKYVRFRSGDMKKSSLKATDFDKGQAVWNTSYARDVYYNGHPSKTPNPEARLQWARVAGDENKEKYRTMYDELIKENRRNP